MSRSIKSYSGPLTAAQILQGIEAAQSNALRLIEDAMHLLEKERYPTTAALAILAIEERGKVYILKNLAIADNAQELRRAWRAYRNHRAKNAAWILPTLIMKGPRTLQGLKGAVDAEGEHTALLDGVKQIAIYTDCLGQAHWSLPEDAVDQNLAQTLITCARQMWGHRAMTLREIELWIEHMKGHFAKPTMIDAVIAFQAAMHAEGLSETTADELASFMAR